jgi:DNA polymerase-3 subunit alpha
VLEALIRSGAMDDFLDEEIDVTRARLMAQLADALQGAEQTARDSALGMSDMFGGIEDAGQANGRNGVAPLTKRERLEDEKDALGLYLTGHPIEDYLGEIQQFCRCNIAGLRAEKRTQKLAGLVVSARTMRSRRGDRMGFIVVDDRSGRIEVSLFPDVYEAEKDKIAKDAVLVIEGEVQPDDYTGMLKMRAEQVHTIEEARSRFVRGLVIDCGRHGAPADISSRLRTCLEPHRGASGGCTVSVIYEASNGEGAGARGRITLGPEWGVDPSDDLLRTLRAEFGAAQVALNYDAGS